LIGTFTGGEVTVLGNQAGTQVTYSSTNSDPWTTTLVPAGSWYTRLEINAGAYSGPVTVTWQLYLKNGTSSWTAVGSSIPTSIVLSGGAESVYASGDGTIGTNFDWSTSGYADVAGTYRVEATVDSA
jgi:hypothetical protein